MTLTDWVLLGILVALVGYDVVVACLGQPPTISERVWYWSKLYPIVPFAAGLLVGHFWWRQ